LYENESSRIVVDSCLDSFLVEHRSLVYYFNKLYFNFNDGNIEYAILFNKCPD